MILFIFIYFIITGNKIPRSNTSFIKEANNKQFDELFLSMQANKQTKPNQIKSNQTYIHTNIQTYIHTNIQTNKQTNKQTSKQTINVTLKIIIDFIEFYNNR